MLSSNVCRLITLGESGAGKSCLLMRYVENEFYNEFIPTIGIDFRQKTVEMKDSRVLKVQVWDTAGQERFRTITHNYYRGAHGIALIYDITQIESFNNIRQWIQDVRTYADASVDLVLIGNKSDLDGERAVEERQGKDLADEYNIPFIETSAKDGSNVNQAFALLVESVYIRVLEKKMKDASRRMQEGAGGSVSSYNSAGGNKNSRRITLGSGDRKQSRKEKMMNKCCK